MFEITETLHGVLLLLVMSYLPASSSRVDPTRVCLEPITIKKSCLHGMVENQDYFTLKGLINISNVENGHYGSFSIYFREQRTGDNFWISETTVRLDGNKTCSAMDRIRIDSCHCTSMDSKYIRLMCNLTARRIYSRSNISLYHSNGGWHFSPSFQLPPVYKTSACYEASFSQAARNHPESFTDLLGTVLLGTAVVCLVSSIISQI
ncbi:unnamed protein product [Lymnaea stagnalis]|uniref:Uncharacterized protein n=1 Tax=Lymnaea stagnalis TaxID=6523 RepID=A0AAV2GZX7_LYMST